MSVRIDRLAGLLVALVVLAAGIAYASTRPLRWASDAQVVLVPVTTAGDSAAAIDSFESAGTLGTVVELLASPDLARTVTVPGATFAARAVPDTRVIGVTATGADASVQRALGELLRRAGPVQRSLGDRWALRTLVRPTAPVAAGPSTTALLGLAAALAALAGVAAAVAIGRTAAAGHRRVRLLPRRRGGRRATVRATTTTPTRARRRRPHHRAGVPSDALAPDGAGDPR